MTDTPHISHLPWTLFVFVLNLAPYTHSPLPSSCHIEVISLVKQIPNNYTKLLNPLNYLTKRGGI